jgi:hypothetical protein
MALERPLFLENNCLVVELDMCTLLQFNKLLHLSYPPLRAETPLLF